MKIKVDDLTGVVLDYFVMRNYFTLDERIIRRRTGPPQNKQEETTPRFIPVDDEYCACHILDATCILDSLTDEEYDPHCNFNIAMRISQEEGIELSPLLGEKERKPFRGWFAGRSIDTFDLFSHEAVGDNMCEAAMRCYVKYKMGDYVFIPDRIEK